MNPTKRRRLTPVPVRPRHDGWTVRKQAAFIEALAESGCVEEACAMAGMGRTSAYALRARSDAASFRIAWLAALDVAIFRLGDAVRSRAINGTVQPIFYKGEQVGERRHFNDRLAMFLLRYHQPERYGAWRDRVVSERGPDGASQMLDAAFHNMMEDGAADDLGLPRPVRAPLALEQRIDP